MRRDCVRVSLGQLVKIIREAHLSSVIDNLVLFIGGKDDELRDIAGLGESHIASYCRLRIL